MGRKSGQRGAIMVEASIYVPIVLCVVMMLMYYGLFTIQTYMMTYEAERVAIVVAREEAYLGYEHFEMGSNNLIDFKWEGENQPPAEQVKAYYDEYNSKISNIYREIGGLLSAIGVTNPAPAAAERLAGAGREAVFLAIGTMSDAEVDVSRSIFGAKVVVRLTHSLPTPGVLKYLGLGEHMQLKATAYSYSVNGSSMVRNVDFAVDLVKYILDKFGVGEKVDDFVEKLNSVLDKIL